MSNKKYTLTFATAGPNSRTTQCFFNLNDNSFLDNQGFTPFGVIAEGDKGKFDEAVYTGYGESMPRGKGPTQQGMMAKGNEYGETFELLTKIVNVEIV